MPEDACLLVNSASGGSLILLVLRNAPKASAGPPCSHLHVPELNVHRASCAVDVAPDSKNQNRYLPSFGQERNHTAIRLCASCLFISRKEIFFTHQCILYSTNRDN